MFRGSDLISLCSRKSKTLLNLLRLEISSFLFLLARTPNAKKPTLLVLSTKQLKRR